MKKIQGVLSAAIVAILLFSSVNALALSDLDTRFSVQLTGWKKKLQCDFLIISNGSITCTNKSTVEQVSLSLISQLNIIYMGKEYSFPRVKTSDIDSINAMSMRKGQAVLTRQAGRKNIIGSLEPRGRFHILPFFGGVLISSLLIFLFLFYKNTYKNAFRKKIRFKGGKRDSFVFRCSFCEKSLRVGFPFNSLTFRCSNCHNKYDIETLSENRGVYMFIPETKATGTGSSRTTQSRTSPLPEEVKKAFFLFGLNENATLGDAKTAYRKCMAEYHPDKVSHLGEEFHKIAEEKTKAYNIAFDVVKKHFSQQS